MPFNHPASLAINQARMEHLGSLGLPLENRSVLEVGAGIGLLTGFFEALNCRVLSIDGRRENTEAINMAYPWRRVRQFDLNRDDYNNLGRFEIVFCYGTLYHITNTARVLANLSSICDSLLLLETLVWPIDDGLNRPAYDNAALNDQSLDGRGCRPSRNFIWTELLDLFPYVYAPSSQPDHPEFPLSWPASPNNNTRAVFIASRFPLNLPTLTDTLPGEYESLSI